jgi:hypothetical protein
MAENGTTVPAGYFFPFKAEIDQTLSLPRLTLRGLHNPSNLALSKAAAERVFVCRDDLTTGEIDTQSRPVLSDDNADGTLDYAVMQTGGNYSYLVMVTPSELENPYPTQPLSAPLNPADPLNLYVRSVPIGQRRLFTVQVVMFHRRVLLINSAPPGERQLKAQVISGHSAILEPPNAAGTDGPAYLDGLAVGQWIMLSSFMRPSNDPAPGESTVMRPIHRWVRVISIGKTANTGQTLVNFAGPEWNATMTQWTPPENMSDGNPPNAVATIADGVVGVYERNVELDARSLTAP